MNRLTEGLLTFGLPILAVLFVLVAMLARYFWP